MTVGIGVLAESGRTVIVGSDMRATFPKSSVSPNDQCGKQWDFPLPFNATACVAGTIGAAQPLVGELTVQLQKLLKKPQIVNEHVENAIDEARFLVHRRRVDWEFRKSYGIKLREWLRGKVPGGKLDPLILKAGEILIQSTHLPVELLVGGYIGGRILLYKASGKRQLEAASTPGIMVIGSGGQLAMEKLNQREQNLDCSLARSAFHVLEALEAARNESNKTVGPPSNLIVIDDLGHMGQLPPFCQALQDFKKAYADRDSTWSLQRNNVANAQIRCQLIAHRRRLHH